MTCTDIHYTDAKYSFKKRISDLLQKLYVFSRYLARCIEVARQRRQLGNLDDAALRDIGLSRSEVMKEANRGFWDTSDEKRKPSQK